MVAEATRRRNKHQSHQGDSDKQIIELRDALDQNKGTDLSIPTVVSEAKGIAQRLDEAEKKVKEVSEVLATYDAKTAAYQAQSDAYQTWKSALTRLDDAREKSPVPRLLVLERPAAAIEELLEVRAVAIVSCALGAAAGVAIMLLVATIAALMAGKGNSSGSAASATPPPL